MPQSAADVLHTLPARPLRPEEREVVAEWLAAADGVTSAYIAERGSDDPAMYRRIVISLKEDGWPTHLIHTRSGMDKWVLLDVNPEPKVRTFGSLPDALNSIRRVLPSHGWRLRQGWSKQ
jgi:hypothetical protein